MVTISNTYQSVLDFKLTPCYSSYVVDGTMNYEIDQIQKFTVEEFQSNFDELFDRVLKGEMFIITKEGMNSLIVPYVDNEFYEEDEIRQVHTQHDDGP